MFVKFIQNGCDNAITFKSSRKGHCQILLKSAFIGTDFLFNLIGVEVTAVFSLVISCVIFWHAVRPMPASKILLWELKPALKGVKVELRGV